MATSPASRAASSTPGGAFRTDLARRPPVSEAAQRALAPSVGIDRDLDGTLEGDE